MKLILSVGGETQRLAASRTFMRISSGRIKLVVADEPTSAMDPEGELQLFQALRDIREGKTMIFITHRFGHLTKHADLILSVSIFDFICLRLNPRLNNRLVEHLCD